MLSPFSIIFAIIYKTPTIVKNLFHFIILAVIAFSCNNHNSEVPYQSGVSSGEVKEVIQTSQYTYLLVNENGSEKWLATKKMEAKKGEVYFYSNGYEMNDFASKELGRTFKSVLFIDRIGKTAEEITQGPMVSGNEPVKAEVRKYELDISRAENGIRIATLFENKNDLAGKRVVIKGKVTHYNASIMKRNWIHLQDGTEFSGKYDLTATSDTLTANIGQVITIEGTVELDKDFGYGYFYEVLLTDIKIIEE